MHSHAEEIATAPEDSRPPRGGWTRCDVMRPVLIAAIVGTMLTTLCSCGQSPGTAAESINDSGSELALTHQESSRHLTGFGQGQAANIPPNPGALPPLEAPRPGFDASQPAPVDPDQRAREQALGLWRQYETGTRYLSIQADGTATMLIEADWKAALLIGSRLTVEINWTIDDGLLTFHSVSGKPQSGFDALTTLYGRDRVRRLETISKDLLVMVDPETGKKSEYTRLGPTDKIPPELRGK